MIFDYYEENKPFVSLWLGNFENVEQLQRYVATVYLDFDAENGDLEWQQKRNQWFLPTNANRVGECELYQGSDESFNQFEYDFECYFDPDFMEVSFRNPTSDWIQLIENHSYYAQFKDIPITLTQTYNAVILIYNCAYDGHIANHTTDDYSLDYIAHFPYVKTP
ncbi:hypothetical protein G7062_02700 [Erysipelothrix sp. HDW6C]|uniref:immunity 22 family protein n=1 Tax=Erysipelothrix sp. HDW6C TaxID=2714930 RepID=UPI0014098CFD|nr:immunity 22 family protein [Erysipelothrix sp. HDW6C]QIK69264.1 hypothetical protein G7062_02700 [Erysipelothrix sp. HDW6C]